MAGRLKVKQAGLRPLAAQAQRLASPVVRWTWVPRERNADADRLLNEALDAASRRRTSSGPLQWRGGGSSEADQPTTLLLVTPVRVTRPLPLLTGWPLGMAPWPFSRRPYDLPEAPGRS